MPLRLTQYDVAEGGVDLGELWALANDGHGLRLVVRTHPKGWQLCLCRDGEVMRLDQVRHKARVVFLAARWLANAEKAGWTRLREDTIADPLEAERDRPSRRRTRSSRANEPV
jgi:hypothetical protein